MVHQSNRLSFTTVEIDGDWQDGYWTRKEEEDDEEGDEEKRSNKLVAKQLLLAATFSRIGQSNHGSSNR